MGIVGSNDSVPDSDEKNGCRGAQTAPPTTAAGMSPQSLQPSSSLVSSNFDQAPATSLSSSSSSSRSVSPESVLDSSNDVEKSDNKQRPGTPTSPTLTAGKLTQAQAKGDGPTWLFALIPTTVNGQKQEVRVTISFSEALDESDVNRTSGRTSRQRKALDATAGSNAVGTRRGSRKRKAPDWLGTMIESDMWEISEEIGRAPGNEETRTVQSSTEATATTAPSDEKNQVVRRPRGRPRKYPLDMQKVESPPRRKRGRPRKHPPVACDAMSAQLKSQTRQVDKKTDSKSRKRCLKLVLDQDGDRDGVSSGFEQTRLDEKLLEARVPSPEEPIMKKHWTDLDYKGHVLDYRYGDLIPVDFGNGLDNTLNAINSALVEIGERSLPENDPFIVESKMYQRSMKERQQRSDAERIEKVRNRDEYESRLREFQYYHNSNRKRSAVDVQMEEFCVRPVHYPGATRESARHMICEAGPACRLCRQTSQSDTLEGKHDVILAPSFRPVHVFESQKLFVAPEEVDLMSNRRQAPRSQSRPRRARNGRNRVEQSADILMEMKHSLTFIQRYNKGYL